MPTTTDITRRAQARSTTGPEPVPVLVTPCSPQSAGLCISLRMPRAAPSVPLVRRILLDTLDSLGVPDELRFDVAVALSEACSNVIEHAGAGDHYLVTVRVRGDRCSVTVTDHGTGFTAREERSGGPRMLEEHGRGLQIIRNLTDRMRVTHRHGRGSMVRFEKDLTA